MLNKFPQSGLRISELAERAGVSVRTVRYYISEGLLPAPDTPGRYAEYTKEHLIRLELIQRLKEAFLPLDEIRIRLEGLDDAAIADLHANWQGPPVSAASRIAESSSAELDDAATYLARLRDAHVNLDQHIESTTRSQRLKSLPDADDRRAYREKRPERQRWEREELAPGIELHIRYPHDPKVREAIRRLRDFARRLFG